MNFTSPLFLFLFIPLVLLVFNIAPERFRSWVLLIFSIIFYLWGELDYAIAVCVTIVLNYLAAIFIERAQGKKRDIIFWSAIAINLLLLVMFKYSIFLFNILPSQLGLDLPFNTIPNSHLPLGISFFTFLAISYLVDVRNEICTASRNLKETSLYFLFFPRVTAGPLTRFCDFSRISIPTAVLSEEFSEGVKRFITGLARKVLLATPLMKAASNIFNSPNGTLDMPTAWLGVVLFSLQIYHDFGGYSDMAIGLGLMFGYKLPENFNYPYSALSFTDFWRRWHITLSSWLKDYLFIPLNRALITDRFRERFESGEINMLGRTCFSLCCVFIVCGIWHGAGWNFVLWGLSHGLFLSFEQTWVGKQLSKAPVALRRLYLLVCLALTWVLFRLESIKEIKDYLQPMLNPRISPLAPNVWTGELIFVVLVALLFSFPFIRRIEAYIPVKARDMLLIPAYLLLLVIAVASVASNAYNPFIYARF